MHYQIGHQFFTYNQLLHLPMFEENSSSHQNHHSQNSGTHETTEERLDRIKKSKNIRKEKIKQKRSQNLDNDLCQRKQLTKEQKKEIQKQKNRVAAQLSRDRHKVYVDELEGKIKQLERQIQSQLCRKCKAVMTDTSSTEEEQFHDQISHPISVIAKQSNSFNFLDEPEVDDLPLVRDNSRNDMEWGGIGRYFCLVLFCLAVVLVSSSVETTNQGSSAFGKQVSRVLTVQNQICNKKIQTQPPLSSQKLSVPSTLSGLNMLPLELNERMDQCKNDFWNNYLEGIKQQANNPYDWNLVSCNNPYMHHISTVYEDGVSPLQHKWTFLITNPTVSHSYIQGSGDHYIDEVSQLSGVYQVIAQNVVLKKVLGKNCLT